MDRIGGDRRKTHETDVEVSVNLDGKGESDIQTTIPFFDHMLAQLARHGLFDLRIRAIGDTDVDFHHTVEDVGISLGKAFAKALGDKKGIRRFADASVPLNEALARCSVDVSGRAFFVFNANLPKSKIGEFDVELVAEFFQAFSANAGLTLHIEAAHWSNLHHVIEAMFKALARCLCHACSLDPRSNAIPSTKGQL
jgi:imidazoleglycerol-phosphate dehydratase